MSDQSRETAAQENASSFFPLLDRIAEGRFVELPTERELYDGFLDVLRADGHFAEPDALSSFRLALSVRSAAPRIEAHYQYYNTSIQSSLMVAQDAACPVWVHAEGKQYCSSALEIAQQDFEGPPHNLPFDRTLSLNPEAPVSTLYTDLVSPAFADFHRTLSDAARTGQITYRVRYRPPLSPSNKPLSVSGYGVELALKRTDYIVIDDRDGKDATGAKAATTKGEVSFDADEMDDLKPLSASELLGLGLKTSSYIMAQKDPLAALEKISQDFPKYSSAISKLRYSEAFLLEHRHNREQLLPAGSNAIWLNGLQIEARQMNAFALLDKLRHERKLMRGFRDIGLTPSEAVSLISHAALEEAREKSELQRYDYRDGPEGGNVIIWLNDIEKDKRYESWSSDPVALLQRTFPGQLPVARLDIHNVVVPLDLANAKDLAILVNTLQVLVKRMIPIRIGFVPLVSSAETEKQAKIAFYLQEHYGLSALLAYVAASLEDKQGPQFKSTRLEAAIQKRDIRPNKNPRQVAEIFVAEDFAARVANVRRYLRRLGLNGATIPAFANGVAVPKNDALMQYISERISVDATTVQRKVYEAGPSADVSSATIFLDGASTSRNPLVIPSDESSITIVNIGQILQVHGKIYEEAPKIQAAPDAMKQFWTQIVVVADLDSREGINLLEGALDFKDRQSETQLVILHSPDPHGTGSGAPGVLFDLMSREKPLGVDALRKLIEMSRVGADVEPHQMAETFWARMVPLVSSLGLEPGQNGVFLNGRQVGPIPDDMDFGLVDFESLLSYERSKRITPVNTALVDLNLEEKLDSALTAARVTSLVALSAKSDVPEGIFDSASALRTDKFDAWKSDVSTIFKGNAATSTIQIVASIDPTSEIAQRWVPILRVLSELDGVYLELYLNPREKLQEIPVKRFYRHVLNAAPTFDEEGSVADPSASFEGLPKQALLNLALDVPPAWLVSPKEAVQDLDNIKISALKTDADINAVYKLDHILIEGHSSDVTAYQAPRGVQLLLGTESNPHFADTLIMANLGYFQFKANPGYWNIHLKPGRSERIFKIDGIGANDPFAKEKDDDRTDLALTGFQGKTLYPRLSRKPGQEAEDVLEESGTSSDILAQASKFASSFLSSVGLSKKSEHTDINIFSVASGHLYERMLNIMMVSVMRHTKRTVKFWFIEQFLSPSFKETLPYLASEYGFDFEMVTYKWPHWLRGQKEKQREIWGYKILFLDVLFPLSLDKVIFVDADQIVRTDMHDLVALDLHGAPYGFTPMCDSRVEMEGYRFWKQGYWKNTLHGRPYHISALYVVDLRRFRQMAAGDRLRGSYHQLSADPASLSNLDQDLPNNMQAALPIHSLPQEWLWCETWCSDESLREARTIDLCNNPETKEPKLARARRQVPEWTEYDEEIAALFRRAKAERAAARQGAEESVNVQEDLDFEAAKKEGKIKDEL